MTMLERSPRPLFFAVIAGTLCGGVLIAVTALSRNGWLMLLPYVALALASAFYLRSRSVGPFSQRFIPCLIAYIVATAIVILLHRYRGPSARVRRYDAVEVPGSEWANAANRRRRQCSGGGDRR
jgi:hypothetical protein